MILKPTFTNGKNPNGMNIISTKIPATELNQIVQTKLSVETIVVLLNEKENLYSYKQNSSLKWNICQHCQTIFLNYKNPKYCSRQCNGHYRGQDWKKHAHKGREAWSEETKENYRLSQMGEKNPAWKGGITYRKKKGYYSEAKLKYVKCPMEFIQMSRKDGYVVEYRLVMAKQLNRPLLRMECVHHIDHNPTNNDIMNLMLFATNKEHKKYEWGGLIQPLWQPSHLLNIVE